MLAAFPSPKETPLGLMRYLVRLVASLVAIGAVGLTLSQMLGMRFILAALVATPFVLMIGSMLTIYYLARNTETISAKHQMVTLLVVEFVLVPLGAAVALVTFFIMRAT